MGYCKNKHCKCGDKCECSGDKCCEKFCCEEASEKKCCPAGCKGDCKCANCHCADHKQCGDKTHAHQGTAAAH
ncbi:Protein CBR-MTL-1 [Caenorhabditis briggsae]|uniref:Protein CBR-MTL-1 n=1 Tax=Caenorhabditis briggsae TaxID=6238 RepID=A8XUJ0_CAEBR|nr:Protein CBR-MTL-1 [Caenorhabditis briggsae]CAP36315.1 Protein CBR-MTL-1 [Caenorhabditis briggsae]